MYRVFHTHVSLQARTHEYGVCMCFKGLFVLCARGFPTSLSDLSQEKKETSGSSTMVACSGCVLWDKDVNMPWLQERNVDYFAPIS